MSAPSHWRLTSDLDPKGHERFQVMRDSTVWEIPTRVAMFGPSVDKATATAVMDYLAAQLDGVLRRREQETAAWRRRNGR